jgi:hypothetical protein
MCMSSGAEAAGLGESDRDEDRRTHVTCNRIWGFPLKLESIGGFYADVGLCFKRASLASVLDTVHDSGMEAEKAR